VEPATAYKIQFVDVIVEAEEHYVIDTVGTNTSSRISGSGRGARPFGEVAVEPATTAQRKVKFVYVIVDSTVHHRAHPIRAAIRGRVSIGGRSPSFGGEVAVEPATAYKR